MPFLEACIAMREGLKLVATKVGRSNLYHETITIAFMAVMFERMCLDQAADWENFLEHNSDLCDRALLTRYYTPSMLESPMARTQFLLCDHQSQMEAVSVRN